MAYLYEGLGRAELEREDLEGVFDENVIGALETLTRRAGEDYEAYIGRIAEAGGTARAVKLAALEDALDGPARPSEAMRTRCSWARKRLR